MAIDAVSCDFGGWQIRRVRNPWGKVPHTAGGKSLTEAARAFMDNLMKQQDADDPVSRRHHYVPKAYLCQWSFDGRRSEPSTRSRER